MHFRRLNRPINDTIRTTVRSIENYRECCLEVQTSSIDGSAMTLTIFIDGAQCFRKPVGSSNEAMMLARGTKIGMQLIDAMVVERDTTTTGEARAPIRHDGDSQTVLRPSA